MTEEEARKKWCVQSVSTDAAMRCAASACMAWEWSEPKRTAAFLEAVQAKMQAQAKPNFNTATQEVFAETGGQFARVEGDCGLKRGGA